MSSQALYIRQMFAFIMTGISMRQAIIRHKNGPNSTFKSAEREKREKKNYASSKKAPYIN